MPRRNVTAEPLDPRERYALYRLCDCPICGGSGKAGQAFSVQNVPISYAPRCRDCRGEGRIRQEVAACATPEAVGVALVTLAREGEFEECPLGLLDRLPECAECDGSGENVLNPAWPSGTEPYSEKCAECSGMGVKPTGTWLISPWLPSARNVSDAGRVLARSKKTSRRP